MEEYWKKRLPILCGGLGGAMLAGVGPALFWGEGLDFPPIPPAVLGVGGVFQVAKPFLLMGGA